MLNNAKKMIYVGTLSNSPDRDTGWIQSFEKLGYIVHSFSTQLSYSRFKILSKFQRRFNLSVSNYLMQKKLLRQVDSLQPFWVHFRLPIEFSATTIKKIKEKGIFVSEYCNDDPFSPSALSFIYWKFKKAIKLYDAHFVYRFQNIADFGFHGSKNVYHCPPAFDTSRCQILSNSHLEYLYDATFIGHYEDDLRFQYLETLSENGYKLFIAGSNWNKVISNSKNLKKLYPINPIFGKRYQEVYSKTLAGLCFFSKINRDNWTERPFEIIASGGLLVCERTEEAQSYFEDKKEAFFFSSIPELLEIITFLKENNDLVLDIKKRGFHRFVNSKNFIINRAEFIENIVIENLKNV